MLDHAPAGTYKYVYYQCIESRLYAVYVAAPMIADITHVFD